MSRDSSSSRRSFRWLIIAIVLLCGLLATPLPRKIYRGVMRVAEDPGESKNLAKKKPDTVSRLMKLKNSYGSEIKGRK